MRSCLDGYDEVMPGRVLHDLSGITLSGITLGTPPVPAPCTYTEHVARRGPYTTVSIDEFRMRVSGIPFTINEIN